MKKRILSMVLVLCMVVGMLPTTALGFDLSAFSVLETEIETQVITPEQLETTYELDPQGEDFDSETLASGVTWADTTNWVGSGSYADPYLISDQDFFDDFVTDVNAGNVAVGTYYLVTADSILVSTAIGTSTSEFKGIFDGNNKSFLLDLTTISSEVRSVGTVYHGMFGVISANGVVMNVNAVGAEAQEAVEAVPPDESAGTPGSPAIAATTKKEVNLELTNQMVATTLHVGSIAGSNKGTIINCSSNADVSAKAVTVTGSSGSSPVVYTYYNTTLNVGGIAGSNSGKIYNSYSTGDVTGDGTSVSGVANSNTTNSYKVSQAKVYVGGLVGNNSSSIYNSYNLGEVSATSTNTAGNSSNSYTPTSIANSGGIAGISSGSAVANCYSAGQITADATGGVTTDSSSNTIYTYQQKYNGGIFGAGGTFTSTYWAVAGAKNSLGSNNIYNNYEGKDSFDSSGNVVSATDSTQTVGLLSHLLKTWVEDNGTTYLNSINSSYLSFTDVDGTTYSNCYGLSHWQGTGANMTFDDRINVFENSAATATGEKSLQNLNALSGAGTGGATTVSNNGSNYTIKVETNENYAIESVRVIQMGMAYLDDDGDLSREATVTPSGTTGEYTFSMPSYGSVVVVVDYTYLESHSCSDHGTRTPIYSETQFAEMTADGKYYLTKDITTDTGVSITVRGVDLCLNCHKIESTNSNVSALTISAADAVIHGGTDATKGIITGGLTGINVTGGSVTTTDLTVSGNTTGVSIVNGTYTMSGGSIIKENTTGVNVAIGGIFNLFGGSIHSNTGNGVTLATQVTNKSIMNLSGSPEVTANGGGGVVVSQNNYMNILEGLTSSASIYATKENGETIATDYNLIAMGEDASSLTSVFSGNTVATNNGSSFYREFEGDTSLTTAIYLSRVQAIAEDFTVKYQAYTDVDVSTKAGLTSGVGYDDSYYSISVVYSGNAPVIEASYTINGSTATFKTSNGGIVLKPTSSTTATDAVTVYNAGDYDMYVVVGGSNNYFIGEQHKIGMVTIEKKPITVTIDSVPQQTYTGSAIEPKPAVTYNGVALKENVDFVYNWDNNIKNTYEEELAVVIIENTADSNYIFKQTVGFEIKKQTTFLHFLEEMDGTVWTYGEDIPVTVIPDNGGETLSSSDWGAYNIDLYVINDDGTETKLKTTSVVGGTSETGSGTSCELTYKTYYKELGIGDHDLIVRFSPINSVTANLSDGEKKFSITILPKALSATVRAEQWREYNGSAEFKAWLDLGVYNGETAGAVVSYTENNKTYTDDVSAYVNGVVESPNVYDKYVLLNVTNSTIVLEGNDMEFYTLTSDNVDTKDRYLEIVAANLSSTNIEKNKTITVMKGVGTYATPEFTYTVGEDEAVVIGSLTYTDEAYSSYDKIVAHLKTLDVNGVLTVGYQFTVDPSVASNYTTDTFTGKITFIVVDIKFDGIDEAIVVKEEAIYGDVNNFFYDPSKFIANIGTSSTTGAYFLTVADSLGSKVTDLSLLKVGDYTYSVSFTSYDGAYIDSFVTSGTFTIIPRPVEIEWNALSFEYDSTEIVPQATITNTVWVDDVSIEVSGGQTNVGDYTGVLSLAGNDKVNYSLAQETVTFKIVPAEAKGLITVSIADNDSSTALSTGDVLTADVSAVTPQGGTIFYHWYRDDILMSSAVWPTYTISAADAVGTTIRCEVTFSGNTTGTISTVGMDVGDYFFTGSATIAHEDGVLTATVSDTNTDDYTILWTGVANSANGDTYTMDLTDYGRTVTVTIIANHGSGYCGSFSTVTSVAAVKPYTPEIEVEAGDACVNVSWEEPFNGGAELESYVLTVTDRDGNHVTQSPFTFDTSVTSYTVMNLVNNNVYTFGIAVKNAVGTTYSENLIAIPRSSEDVDTDGEITTTTTTDEYEDEDGNIITTTVVTEINSGDGSMKVTTTVSTVSPDGSTLTHVTMEETDGTGAVIASSEVYSYKSDDMEVNYEITMDEDGSEGFLDVTTDITDVISLPVSMLQPIVNTDDSTITFITPNATVSFDNAALDTIFTYANPYSDDVLELIAEYTAPDKMPMSIRERLSDAFIMDLTLKLGNVIVTDFDPGYVTITLPYTKFDTSQNVSVYHVADTGSMTRMNNAEYDVNNKTVTFTATHFSYYAVLEEANRFTDIYVTDYYYDAVQWGVENGITSGSTPTTFNPHAKCTRAEAITMLWKAMGSEQSSAYMPFTDVTASDYYFDSFRWAYGTGISTGTKPNLAGPFDVCTRDQIVTFLWIANGKTVVDEELYFSDVPVGGWYTDAIRWAVSEGVTAGSSTTTFSPDNVCTRAEIITFLYKCSTL